MSNLQWILVIIWSVSSKQSESQFKDHDKFCYKTDFGYEADKVCYQRETDGSIYTNSTQNTKRRKRYLFINH